MKANYNFKVIYIQTYVLLVLFCFTISHTTLSLKKQDISKRIKYDSPLQSNEEDGVNLVSRFPHDIMDKLAGFIFTACFS